MTQTRLTRATALQVLRDAGLVLNPDDVSVSALLAYAARQGWSVTAAKTTSPMPSRRWRVVVSSRHVPRGYETSYLGGTLGHGPTEEVALVLAVATMIQRHQ